MCIYINFVQPVISIIECINDIGRNFLFRYNKLLKFSYSSSQNNDNVSRLHHDLNSSL